MIAAYTKVWNTIRSAEYQHLVNGSIMNLINNFYNMYKDKARYDELMSDYVTKLKQFENQN